MGAVQKLATVVIVGLVGLATLLVVYLANEPNRRTAEAEEQVEAAVERGVDTYVQNCMVCHGPAGEGLFGGDGRIGFPLNPAAGPPKEPGAPPDWHDNQSDDPAVWAQREEVLYDAINNGRGAMPAWGTGAEGGALLNPEQIYELVQMIHTVDWNLVYNDVIEANHGVYPPGPTAVPTDAGAGEAEAGGEQAAGGGGDAAAASLTAVDIGWQMGDQSTTNGDAITVTVAPGDTISVTNDGAALHDFVVDALGIKVDLPPGETTTVTIPDDAAPGEYEFYCSVPGHKAAGMVGTLVIQEGGGEVAEQPAEEPAADEAAGEAAAPAAAEAVGPLVAVDIGWELGDQSTTAGDAITLTVSPGQSFELVSEGAANHDFTVDELSVHVVVAPGETTTVTIPEDAAPGEYTFYCSVPGHEAAGMVGTLVVQ